MKYLICLLFGLISRLALGQQVSFKPSFTNMTEVGVLFGQVRYGSQFAESVDKRITLTAQTFNGVLLHPRLALGATVGVDWYNTALLIPICGGIRYDLVRPNQKNLRVLPASIRVGA